MSQDRPKVTIRDVAREANVGVGTVSRVLSRSANVGAETRQHILAVIERLAYEPNRAARNLARGRTDTLGVLLPSFTRHYFLDILRGVQTAASEGDYSLTVFAADRPDQVKGYLSSALKQRVDGLVVISVDPALVGNDGAEMPVPVVGIDTQVEGATSILPDHAAGMYLAARHLIGHGHKRLALIDRPQDPVSGNQIAARRAGFVSACHDGGLPDSQLSLEIHDYTVEAGHKAARRLLALDEPPTAFACASDMQAIGVLRAVAESGRTIGRDVGVMGYHNVDLAEYACLTSIHLSAFEMGRQAVGRLLEGLASGFDERAAVQVMPSLIVRASCGCAEESRLFGWPGFFPGASAGA
jgi:DNA-binding LacI/PurR family transcriptional regulator